METLDQLHCVLDTTLFDHSVKKISLFNRGNTLSLHYFTSGSSCNWFVADVAKYTTGVCAKKQSGLFIYSLFLSFLLSRWFSPKARSLFYPLSLDRPSLTFASQYIEFDGLIPPSPSMGQLTEHKQWQAHLGICGTRPQGENWGEISCSSS